MKQKGTNKQKSNNRNIYILFISLNQEKRRRELLRVSKENATLAKRIIGLKPDGNRESWKLSWSKNASYLDNIARYEPDWHVPKVKEQICLSQNFHYLSHFFQSSSRLTQNGKPGSKRSESEPQDDKKGIKALVITNETATTEVVDNKTQE